MAEWIYLVCGVTSLGCAALLLRQYRRTRTRLLAWSTLCFAGLTVNNALLWVDLVAVPDVDLSLWRTGVAFVSVATLALGLAWESR
jgi:hypothetical protein